MTSYISLMKRESPCPYFPQKLVVVRILKEYVPVKVLCRLMCSVAVFREDEDDLEFPKDECKPLSTLCPPPVPE